ncbi:MAG: glycerate kinase [Halobacteriaceae archaeon]
MFRDRETLERSAAHALALDCAAAGVAAARPDRVVREAVRVDGDSLRVEGDAYDLGTFDEVVVVGGGKAGAQVAAALEDVLGDRLAGGVVVTDDPVPCERVEVLPGSHPVPSEEGVASTRRLLDAVAAADERTLVLAVITGGGSALMAAPVVPLADLQATTDALLDSGATIHEMNAVRKHLSEIKGGQLARAAAPATVVSLLFSDVVGDDPDVIASGPTVPDTSTYGDALAVCERYDLDLPASVRERLEAGAAGDVAETPKPGDAAFERTSVHVVANATTAIRAARQVAREAGYDTCVLSSRVRGEAREQGLGHVAVAEEVRATGNPVSAPAVVLSGGECTVTVRGDGTGGPNQEFALRAAVDLEEGVLACLDTDGRDGSTDVAGAIVDGETVDDAEAAWDALADNDATPYLAARDALIETGRTGTNVNDLRVLVVP